ncbi:Na+/proline symporter [Halogeometricum borinquense DSM 11551]|uniref:Na+/proline symporter n=1 Tax=Halogeometricum borinquense (strain ATCC 700274 / DSM 11551 / JCM 10706 / KCTC 4070 / PR3) TaxID=469382 RepID=E4NU75_HALBP|nr:sodium:proline symporter [Halogeometricum borinquense]ADQ68595.1 Na+/proline symporter [Halogeometricum borinquense DSM 11551]ELY25534.1 Na+/proline symporter [Halogeometricum borinquense DSM 11551]
MVSSTIALALTVATLVIFTGIGVWFSRGKVESVEDLITARNATGEGQMSATLIASVMGVWILLSAPEAGALYGIAAVIGYGIGEAVPMLAYSRLGPRIRELIPEGHSLTEYAYARYGGAMYAFVIVVSVLYMFVFLAAELTGISLALNHVAGIPQWQTAVLVGGFVLLYTGYGGLRASIFTDTIQTMVILPLLVLSVAAVILTLGGPGAIHQGVVEANATLLDPGFVPGLRFGIALVFAVLGAELVNQTWWQRIYAATDSGVLERGFRTATVANGLILVLATLLGVVAVGNADVVTQLGSENYNAGIAFFVLLEGVFGEWLVLGVLLLALTLVMSTADTLFNALSSLVTADLPRLLNDPDDRTLRLGARAVTVVVAVAAIAVSLRARSVLRLFFVADLLGAAVGFPLVYGLFTGRLSGAGALASSITGLAVGSAFFPFPFGLHGLVDGLLGGALPAPDATYLLPFASAFLVSTVLALAAARLSTDEFDLSRLSREIRRLDEPVPDGGTASETGRQLQTEDTTEVSE